jgi:hypothetical protein
MVQGARFTCSCLVYQPLVALSNRSSVQLVESSASWTQAGFSIKDTHLLRVLFVLKGGLRLFAGLFRKTWCTVSSRRQPRPRVHGYRGRLHRRRRKLVGMDQKGAKAEFLEQLYLRRAHFSPVGRAVRLASTTSSHSLIQSQE